MYRNKWKRLFDFAFSFFLLILLTPILIIISALIKSTSGGPIFFNQYRLGKNGKEFLLFKFRTMTNKPRLVDKEISVDNSELTFVGKYLRRYKIDELPQLLNILIGDMSLVGPRPGMPSQKSFLNEDGKVRLKVLPGLTGLAQISGNIYLDWNERWKLDRIYVENLNFFLDIKILIKTILIVLFGEEKYKINLNE
jgi:lipopolysaccharide/colanic/teichoic acid biosynthesis glycosyltransferase